MSTPEKITKMIGRPENERLEYKAVLPPARSLAQMMAAFANTHGGTIILGVHAIGNDISVTGLSEDFHAIGVTHKAIDLLTPRPSVNYDHVTLEGKKLYAISVAKSPSIVTLEGKIFKRVGQRTVLDNPIASSTSTVNTPLVAEAATLLSSTRNAATGAKLKFVDHYTGVLNLIADLSRILYPKDIFTPTTNQEGKILMRILLSSCADNLEIYLTDILYEIYLAKPSTLKSNQQVSVKEVLDCADMQEFVQFWAKKKLGKLQRGSVKGFISENQQIKDLGVLDEAEQDKIEKILQIRHLYAHRNGIVDEKFLLAFEDQYELNQEHQLSVSELMDYFTYLTQIVHEIDKAAVDKYQLATL